MVAVYQKKKKKKIQSFHYLRSSSANFSILDWISGGNFTAFRLLRCLLLPKKPKSEPSTSATSAGLHPALLSDSDHRSALSANTSNTTSSSQSIEQEADTWTISSTSSSPHPPSFKADPILSMYFPTQPGAFTGRISTNRSGSGPESDNDDEEEHRDDDDDDEKDDDRLVDASVQNSIHRVEVKTAEGGKN